MSRIKAAIVGRPNVGKSTLFNKLCGKRLAITHDLPGVTRDLKIHKGRIGKYEFDLIDTAGIDFSTTETIASLANEKSESTTELSDVMLFVVDGRGQLTELDVSISKNLRKSGKPIVLVVNKCEHINAVEKNQFYKLGYKQTVFVSAEHNIGFSDIAASIEALGINPGDEVLDEQNVVKIAILGKPNAGKSTILNKLIGKQWAIASEIAGTTRDAIAITHDFEGQQFEVIDTAGLRRKTKIDDDIEKLSSVESINALRRAHVVIFIADATEPFSQQDMSILSMAVKEGKPFLMCFNKCDLIEDLQKFREQVARFISDTLHDIIEPEIIFISALKSKSINHIFRIAIKLNKLHAIEIPTSKLNRWLAEAVENHAPPESKKGKRIKMKFVNQVAVKPPTFMIYGNSSSDIPQSYIKYLVNNFCSHFELGSIPIRIRFKKSDNPFDKKK